MLDVCRSCSLHCRPISMSYLPCPISHVLSLISDVSCPITVLSCPISHVLRFCLANDLSSLLNAGRAHLLDIVCARVLLCGCVFVWAAVGTDASLRGLVATALFVWTRCNGFRVPTVLVFCLLCRGHCAGSRCTALSHAFSHVSVTKRRRCTASRRM